MNERCVRYARYIVSLCVCSVSLSNAESTISPSEKYGWGENTGWTNWQHDAPKLGDGVIVHDTFMEGRLWAENVGWINIGNGGGPYANSMSDASTFGINIAADGILSGLAWGENVGWVNFGGVDGLDDMPVPARIACATPPTQQLSRLIGYVWAENVGWINLGAFDYSVSIAKDMTPVQCDLNHDLVVDGRDIQLFVEFVLGSSDPEWRDVCSGDVEDSPDGRIGLDDALAFVECVLSDTSREGSGEENQEMPLR